MAPSNVYRPPWQRERIRRRVFLPAPSVIPVFPAELVLRRRVRFRLEPWKHSTHFRRRGVLPPLAQVAFPAELVRKRRPRLRIAPWSHATHFRRTSILVPPGVRDFPRIVTLWAPTDVDPTSTWAAKDTVPAPDSWCVCPFFPDADPTEVGFDPLLICVDPLLIESGDPTWVATDADPSSPWTATDTDPGTPWVKDPPDV